MFLTFDEFKEDLGSWAEPLENFTKGKIFQDIYKFVQSEYESEKKVISSSFRFILLNS